MGQPLAISHVTEQLKLVFEIASSVLIASNLRFHGMMPRNDAQRQLITTNCNLNNSQLSTTLNSKLKPNLPHHLKTPPRHSPPNDILVVLVEKVVATQLDAELLELLA